MAGFQIYEKPQNPELQIFFSSFGIEEWLSKFVNSKLSEIQETQSKKGANNQKFLKPTKF